MQISTQLCIEAHERRRFSLEDIRRKIANITRVVNLQHLMIWIDDDPDLYPDIIQICREHNIAPYLWFPVLADIPGYPIEDDEQLLNYQGQRGYGRIGRWEQLGHGAEQFRFLCPNHANAVEKVFQIYQSLLQEQDFDGVFLDRIRYPSFTNGFDSLFTCFCRHCQEKFMQQYGWRLETYQSHWGDFIMRLSQLSPDDIASYTTLEALWELDDLPRFLNFRAANIFDVVKRFSDAARASGKEVGLDLYTPSLAPFVSQNYQLLSTCGDWIKPMSYCHALGPAGVPLEIACFIDAVQQLCPQLNETHIIQYCERVLDVTLPETRDELLERGIPEQFVAEELHKIYRFHLPTSIKIYPGVEIVKHPDFTLNIDHTVVERYVSHVHPQADGLVASWNLLYIPDEYWRILGMY